jgi:TRAP-type C4-dicarboxylate transport system permease small subunit
MRKALLWLGGLLCVIGVGLIAANIVMRHLGLSASYNFGDPAKFEFILVPFWQIGLAAAVIGAACLWAARRFAGAVR